MDILLDTCAFLWIISGDSCISETARRAYMDPENKVFLSSISACEIAMKCGLGRLALPVPADVFVPEQRDRHGVSPLPLQEDAALQLSRLPALHRDPFDRRLICQSIAHGMAILTPDEWIRQYPVRCLC